MVSRITRCAAMIAINLISGYVLKFFPNVKPATVIIIFFAVYYSLVEALFIGIGSALVQAVCFGFGTFIPFQILAWCLIAVMAYILRKSLKHNLWFVVFSIIMGYFYGFIVSLDMLFILGPKVFIVYYLNGLLFDTFHAVGNGIFSIVLVGILLRIKNEKHTA